MLIVLRWCNNLGVLMAKKSKLRDFVEKERKILQQKEKELESRVRTGVDSGKVWVGHETEEFKVQVKAHPIEYVAGAFIVGLVIGKLMK